MKFYSTSSDGDGDDDIGGSGSDGDGDGDDDSDNVVMVVVVVMLHDYRGGWGGCGCHCNNGEAGKPSLYTCIHYNSVLHCPAHIIAPPPPPHPVYQISTNSSANLFEYLLCAQFGR